MNRKVVTDIELRSHWQHSRETVLVLDEGTVLTPAARDFIRENGITVTDRKQAGVMPVEALPLEHGRPVYVDAATGEKRAEKGEMMTHLNGNVLVPKTDPRIAFRGKLDTLEAQILCLQCTASEKGMTRLCSELGELLSFTRSILAAEVKSETLASVRLLNMSSAEIRETSHRVKEKIGIGHPVPDYTMGSFALRLNLLRTQVRETELACANAFTLGGTCTRVDLVEGLNRLSSCVYILFCRYIAGYYA